jgi:hypothetical protein
VLSSEAVDWEGEEWYWDPFVQSATSEMTLQEKGSAVAENL